MTRIRLLFCLFAAVMSSLFGAVVFAPSTFAAPLNCTTFANYHDGYFQVGHPEYKFEGASSYIVVRNGTNCAGTPGIDRFVNSYVMIAGHNGSRGYGQVGFEKSEGKQLRWFSQFNDGDGAIDTRYSSYTVEGAIGVRHTFRVLYETYPGNLVATIDSTVWDRSAFNPNIAPNWGPQPWSPQFEAESGYTASAIPGAASTPTQYTGMGAQRSSDNGLVSMPCSLTAASDSTKWNHAASSCSAVKLWSD